MFSFFVGWAFLFSTLPFFYLVEGGKITDLHAALTPETMDFSVALKLIHTLDRHEVDVPIYGDRPLLHHALNLYFMSPSQTDRATLIDIMQALIARHIDINAPYNSDPDVVFKAIVIRELGLAHSLAGGGGLTNNSISLTQLYSLPCDPIPISKLLLHAHSVVESHQSDEDGALTLDQVKALLAGASLGNGAKAAAKATDLWTYSSSFESLLEQMVTPIPTGTAAIQGFSLQTIINSLGELGSSVHVKLLENFLAASTDRLEGLGHLANLLATFDKKGRNPLHTLAMSGGSSLVQDLVTTFSTLNERKTKRGRRIRGKLSVALSATDLRGHTPIAYAALRYGPASGVYQTFRALAEIARAEVDEVVMEFLFASHEKSITRGTSGQAHEGAASGDSGAEDVEGGWSETVLDEGLRGDPMRCDILEVWTGEPSPEEFFMQYISLGKPVVFRNAMQLADSREWPNNPETETESETETVTSKMKKSLRATLSKERFLEKYGDESIPVSTIPYASSFGVGVTAMSLREVADMELGVGGGAITEEATAEGDSGVGEGSGGEVPLYAFSTALPGWRTRIEKDAGRPELLQGGVANDVEMQFYLGQAGTGAPMHYHGHAVNSLAYGEKRWFLLPPSGAIYSKTPSLEYARALQARGQDAALGPEAPMQCTQRAGDLMYVPTLWGHATLNTKQCIGVAHEFSVDDICME